jgi:hypothetical protein
MRIAALICAATLSAHALFADTIVMHSGQTMEGKILSSNGDTVEVEVEFGTLRIPAAMIKSVEQLSEKEIQAREEEKAQEKEFVENMRAEGKVLYKGKWVDAEEKEEAEKKIAEEKKKKDEAKAAAKKKKEEELAKKKQEEEKRLAEEQRRREQLANENGRYDPRAERFDRGRRNRNDETNNNNNYTNNNNNSYRNSRNQVNQAYDDFNRNRNGRR